VYRSANYPTDLAAAEAFVATQRHGYLIATPPGGHPSVTVLPFIKSGELIELHCVQDDETFAAVQANPKVTFFVCDYLAWSLHYWVNPDDGGRATLHFRAVQYTCEATTITAPEDVAATLGRLLSHYEPGASYPPLQDGDVYGPRLRRLAAVRLVVLHTEAKFKVGPAAPSEVKRGVVAGLRQRNEPGDARAADVIEASLPGYSTPTA
jgi:predicted FMN-binding regulatory protein PaiB